MKNQKPLICCSAEKSKSLKSQAIRFELTLMKIAPARKFKADLKIIIDIYQKQILNESRTSNRDVEKKQFVEKQIF
jgi:hypothetical protein